MTFFGNIKVFEHDVLFHRLPYLRAETNPLEIYSGRRRPFVRSCRHYFQIAALPDLRSSGRGAACSLYALERLADLSRTCDCTARQRFTRSPRRRARAADAEFPARAP